MDSFFKFFPFIYQAINEALKNIKLEDGVKEM
jgi:hypothetical protein